MDANTWRLRIPSCGRIHASSESVHVLRSRARPRAAAVCLVIHADFQLISKVEEADPTTKSARSRRTSDFVDSSVVDLDFEDLELKLDD